ncbi:hypothetical protein FUA23_22000, partial [Neolewinella aurantiaca]
MIQRKASTNDNFLSSFYAFGDRHQFIVIEADRDVLPLRPAAFRIVGEDEGTAGTLHHGRLGQQDGRRGQGFQRNV